MIHERVGGGTPVWKRVGGFDWLETWALDDAQLPGAFAIGARTSGAWIGDLRARSAERILRKFKGKIFGTKQVTRQQACAFCGH